TSGYDPDGPRWHGFSDRPLAGSIASTMTRAGPLPCTSFHASDVSTGVRLYSPSGSPSVPSDASKEGGRYTVSRTSNGLGSHTSHLVQPGIDHVLIPSNLSDTVDRVEAAVFLHQHGRALARFP